MLIRSAVLLTGTNQGFGNCRNRYSKSDTGQQVIARVFKLADGTAMTFDAEGDPIRRYCGPLDILHDEILAAAPADAQFFAVDQKSKRTRIARSEF